MASRTLLVLLIVPLSTWIVLHAMTFLAASPHPSGERDTATTGGTIHQPHHLHLEADALASDDNVAQRQRPRLQRQAGQRNLVVPEELWREGH